MRNRNNWLGNGSVNAAYPSKIGSKEQLKPVLEKLSVKEMEQPQHSHASLEGDLFVITDIC